MNSNLSPTDDAIRAVFERRALRGTAGGLGDSILAQTRSVRQSRPWAARLRGPAGRGSVTRILALAILLAALLAVGIATIGSQPERSQPTPVPAPLQSAAFFARPFQYGIPAASDLQLVEASRGMLAFVDGGGDRYGMTEDGTTTPGARGITISSAKGAVVHACRSPEAGRRVPVREAPHAFLADLRTLAGIGLGEPTATTLDGRAALAVTVDPDASACDVADFHAEGSGVGSGYVLLTIPSHLIVADVSGRTVVVQVWAATERDLEAWLPIATQVVDTIHFLPQP